MCEGCARGWGQLLQVLEVTPAKLPRLGWGESPFVLAVLSQEGHTLCLGGPHACPQPSQHSWGVSWLLFPVQSGRSSSQTCSRPHSWEDAPNLTGSHCKAYCPFSTHHPTQQPRPHPLEVNNLLGRPTFVSNSHKTQCIIPNDMISYGRENTGHGESRTEGDAAWEGVGRARLSGY